MTMTRNAIKPRFSRNVRRLRAGFPSGAEFLTRFTYDRPPDFGFGTHANAHLYYKDEYFILRIEFAGDTLRLTPRKGRTQLFPGTTDMSRRFFQDGAVCRLIALLGGFQDGWAEVERPEGIRLHPGTPESLFNELLELVRASL
jgi:hypothetical protein